MDIKEFQEKALDACEGIHQLPNRKKHTKQSAVIHLMEEVGEIAKQVTNEYHRPEKFDDKNLGEELADVMLFVATLARLYEVDLSKEMQDLIERIKERSKSQ
ncbi:MAG: MazG nucleotide pyrophosphohydrolase domain-containing protein [archaeon]